MFCALLGKISGERLQDHWSSGCIDSQLFSRASSRTNLFSRFETRFDSDLAWY